MDYEYQVRTIQKCDFIKLELLNYENQNGLGNIANIYRGTLFGTPVAIKEFHMKVLPDHLAVEFEPYMQTCHPNLITFYGICDYPGNFSMVLELMPYSLYRFYMEYELSWNNIFNFSEQITQGLDYLHSKCFVHQFLKSNNVFLTPDLTIKLADFGLLAIKLESSDYIGNGEIVRWHIPQILPQESIAIFEMLKATDIFNLGLLICEMKLRQKSYQPIIPMGWPDSIKALITKCWKFLPHERSTSKDILKIWNDPEFDIANAKKTPVEGYQAVGLSDILDQDSLKLQNEKLLEENNKLRLENMQLLNNLNLSKTAIDV